METFQALFTSTIELLKVEFTIFGFTLSMWDVFLWTGVAGLILSFVGGLIFHD